MRAVVDEVVDRLDLVDAERVGADGLALNDIGRVRVRVSSPLPAEPYAANRVTGAFILVDEGTNETVGAGMIALAKPERCHEASRADEVGAAAGAATISALRWSERMTHASASSGVLPNSTWRAISHSSRVASSISTYQASSSSGARPRPAAAGSCPR